MEIIKKQVGLQRGEKRNQDLYDLIKIGRNRNHFYQCVSWESFKLISVKWLSRMKLEYKTSKTVWKLINF